METNGCPAFAFLFLWDGEGGGRERERGGSEAVRSEAQVHVLLGRLDYEKKSNIIAMILADIDITIILRILFENMMFSFSMSLPKKHFATDDFEMSP